MKTQIFAVLVPFFATSLFVHAQNVGGKWESATKDAKSIVDLKAEGKVLTGTYTVGGQSWNIEAGRIIDSNTISFEWTTVGPDGGNPVHRSAIGKLNGDEMNVTIKGKVESTGNEFTESMTLKRLK